MPRMGGLQPGSGAWAYEAGRDDPAAGAAASTDRDRRSDRTQHRRVTLANWREDHLCGKQYRQPVRPLALAVV
jgi:hypothetical protein